MPVILSWNARGLGGKSKASHLKKLIFKHKVDMVLILESKCCSSSVPFSIIRNFWGMANLDWVGVDVVGLSGGILCIWNKDYVSVSCSFKFQSWMLLSCRFSSPIFSSFVDVIYAPC
ncbi:hypothetical protein MANES_16G057209v8 [Manihot esculenta]|uniref:Uncharacterized protein n=1 Tax=Manihot esculenta TaxID=3983 RepID=A0ACB7G6K6_MANES|nr:hypothetical protein MANES_16G057209v8 [Manihot esculenta]